MIRSITQQGKTFRMLLGVYPYGTNPGSSNTFDQPKALRQTATIGTIHQGGAVFLGGDVCRPGQMGLQGVLTPQVGTITVADNDFTDPAEVFLGNNRLLANVDFFPGAGVNDTATNLASAINLVPGFSAVATLADVAVSYDSGSSSDVEFRVMHYGAVENFTLVPLDDLMTKGSPDVVEPTLT